MASGVAVLFGDKIRSQTKPFSYLFQLVAAKDPVYDLTLCKQVLELDNNPPDFVRKLKGVFDMYDIFICHASEDKDKVAIPLYTELKKRNINVFIDCFAINWGDSLVSKINTALKKSKFVIAVISDISVKKSWPMKELNAVLSSEIGAEDTKLLPLMVGDGEALLKELPLLADKLFVAFDDNIEEIADKVDVNSDNKCNAHGA
ncbi:toll/interleukin-1 receptor domain-containing protein [Aeromonas molluscorum]|uniref:toll/interleukin-1 receptor domain-containing protein n=1 Tax=Aeromonas molluscorum TaxID=271417 RepID=UPI003F1A5303